ncbi:MAG TPA: prolyl oligopeptidase family serine peptidase [Thermoanaerobaculia bacterium]|nr:prolyl oligopeptidase family serine peptidase [Thermoanaerobaculia bacterium]
MPRLAELDRDYRDRGLALVGVSLDRGRAELERMVRAKGLDWAQVWDGAGAEDGSLARLFHVEGPPDLYVLDSRGRIAGKHLGLDEALALVEKLLAEPPRPFTLEDGLALTELLGRHPVDLSPDGRWVAYAVRARDPSRARSRHYLATGVHRMVEHSEVRITELASGETLVLTEGWGTSWAPRWSPDGSRLAFYSDRTGRPLLWIWSRDEGETRAYDGAVVRTFFAFEVPEWSPDGRFLYSRALSREVEERYGAQPDRWPWEQALAPPGDAGDGAAPAAETPQEMPFVTIHDSRRPRVEGAAPETPGPAAGRGVIDLVRVDVETGEAVRLLEGRAVRDFDLSPDGRHLAVMVQLGPESVGAQQPLFELVVQPTDPAAGGEPVARATVRQGYGISIGWSPGSDAVAFATVGQLAEGDVKILRLADGEVRNLTAALEENLAPDRSSEVYARPLWTPDGRAVLWTGDGDLWHVPLAGGAPRNLTAGSGLRIAAVIAAGDGGTAWTPEPGKAVVQTFDSGSFEAGFARVDLAAGAIEPLLVEARRYPGVARFRIDAAPGAADGGLLVYTAESNVEPADLWAAGPDLREPRRITRINEHLRAVDLGRPRLLSWRAPDGTEERAILVLPEGESAGEKLPLVVSVYAGSRPSRSFHSFGLSEDPVAENPAMFLGRGYAVLYPDIPLAEDAEPLKDMVRPVLAAVEAAIATGRIDPERLGLFGHSYGGYSVNALVTQTDRFAAAVASTGSSDLESYFFQKYFFDGTTGWFETGQGRMGGPPWEHPERYRENSPISYVDRVTTPLLLAHSDADDAYWQSVEMYAGVARQGKVARFLSYRGADHSFGGWPREMLADFWSRVFAWFDEHLGGEAGGGSAGSG